MSRKATTMNRQQRRAALTRARRAEADLRSQAPGPKAHAKARRAFEIIKKAPHTPLGMRANLYSKCVAGVAVLGALQHRGIPEGNSPFHYASLLGQQTASLFAAATLDDVLTVLIEERPDGKWSWDVVVDNGLIFGSREMDPCASRAEAEEAASKGLSMIGRAAEPASDYAPEPEPDQKLQIRVNKTTYVVRNLVAHPGFEQALAEAIRVERTTFDGLMARFANLVLLEGADSHPVALAMLANCGWTHLTQPILDNFCAANGIDDSEKPSATPNRERVSPTMH
jgi:hypothetical protein